MTVMPVMVADHARSAPDRTDADGSRHWITRGANFVIVVTQAAAGAMLSRDDTPDESVVLLHDLSATIIAGDEKVAAQADSLTIMPPGPGRIEVTDAGLVVRIFSHLAGDLLTAAGNAAAYADGAPGVAPLVPWPAPADGYRLRHYRLADYGAPGSNMRVFRSANLMINPLAWRDVPRDVTALSPHVHADFEQASVVLAGNYIHHARYPWTPDMTEWRDDEHLAAGAPSVTVIPPGVIHTSRNIDAPGIMVDVFAPPRMDFARRGIVCNAADYPMPVEQPA